ncbi:hypothetical protein KAI54_03805 [Candidatus Gracilibacteria bacterium]|nr:hypothetical protein [Candidatus Gracilibacteria bacterium]
MSKPDSGICFVAADLNDRTITDNELGLDEIFENLFLIVETLRATSLLHTVFSARLLPSLQLSIIKIPGTGFGITTHLSNFTFSRTSSVLRHSSYTILPTSLNTILLFTTFPKNSSGAFVQIVTK